MLLLFPSPSLSPLRPPNYVLLLHSQLQNLSNHLRQDARATPISTPLPADRSTHHLRRKRPHVSASNQCLDFPPLPLCDSFPVISMPPSMARRRQAERMSVVFSGISDASVLALCVRVSRAWRYAGAWPNTFPPLLASSLDEDFAHDKPKLPTAEKHSSKPGWVSSTAHARQETKFHP